MERDKTRGNERKRNERVWSCGRGVVVVVQMTTNDSHWMRRDERRALVEVTSQGVDESSSGRVVEWTSRRVDESLRRRVVEETCRRGDVSSEETSRRVDDSSTRRAEVRMGGHEVWTTRRVDES
jgi:hypothetical protein